jgi:hypothetical protein
MPLREILLIVKGIDNGYEKANIDLFFCANLLNGSIAKTEVNSKTINYRNQHVIVMNHIGMFHFFSYEHDVEILECKNMEYPARPDLLSEHSNKRYYVFNSKD